MSRIGPSERRAEELSCERNPDSENMLVRIEIAWKNGGTTARRMLERLRDEHGCPKKARGARIPHVPPDQMARHIEQVENSNRSPWIATLGQYSSNYSQKRTAALRHGAR
jgi:hypothetical protein